MRDAVIVEAVRTPVGNGKASGALARVHPVELLGHTLRALVDRSGIDPAVIDDVIGGCVDQVAAQAKNVTRYAVLAAGLPESVPATTIDRQCGSSQQAVHFAAQGVLAGAYDVAVACGVESMSRVPMFSNVTDGVGPHSEGVLARYPGGLVSQGISAELIAARWGFDREEQDAFAVRSHRKAAAATAAGTFTREIAPVKAPGPDGELVAVTTDESIRPSAATRSMARLRPAFYDEETAGRFPQIRWTVTAGNSSPINDGAAAVLITTSERARALGLTPRVRLHSFAVVADDPILMLTAITPATAKVLDRARLSLDDIDLFEVNEAFASVVLAWQRETGVPGSKLNVNGGAIALGHPLGATGARIMTTLVHTMEDRGARYALQTMCEGGGMANATILERL